MFGTQQFGTSYFGDGLLAGVPPDYNPCGYAGFGAYYFGQRPNCADAVPAGDGITYIGWSGSSVDRHNAVGGSSGGFWFGNYAHWFTKRKRHHRERKSIGAIYWMGWSEDKLRHRHVEKETRPAQWLLINPPSSEKIHIKIADSTVNGLAWFGFSGELAKLVKNKKPRQKKEVPQPRSASIPPAETPKPILPPLPPAPRRAWAAKKRGGITAVPVAGVATKKPAVAIVNSPRQNRVEIPKTQAIDCSALQDDDVVALLVAMNEF
jgi:hypothetical protein